MVSYAEPDRETWVLLMWLSVVTLIQSIYLGVGQGLSNWLLLRSVVYFIILLHFAIITVFIQAPNPANVYLRESFSLGRRLLSPPIWMGIATGLYQRYVYRIVDISEEVVIMTWLLYFGIWFIYVMYIEYVENR